MSEMKGHPREVKIVVVRHIKSCAHSNAFSDIRKESNCERKISNYYYYELF